MVHPLMIHIWTIDYSFIQMPFKKYKEQSLQLQDSLTKGELALESQIEGSLVSPITAGEKNLYPLPDLASNIDLFTSLVTFF